MKKIVDYRFPGSFRDPSGHVFFRDGRVLRQVNALYRQHYDHLYSSGLLEKLVSRGLLVDHQELQEFETPPDVYKVIRPVKIPFISHPFEWCFSQLRDAAVTTLKALSLALQHGMILKDASAYNVQFLNGKPILLDTLSFERYSAGQPWAAYRQFCQHFIAPLALISYCDVRLGQLLKRHIDGIPLDLVSSLLPLRTRFRFGTLTHLHLHARVQRIASDAHGPSTRQHKKRVGLPALLGLVDSLHAVVSSFHWKPATGIWWNYYLENNYSESTIRQKENAVRESLRIVRRELQQDPRVWDLGANTGRFSHVAAEEQCSVIAIDGDPAATERHYLHCNKFGQTRILPLLIDLANPTSRFGWACDERESIVDRGPTDVVMALALVHHLAIGNNLPLSRIAEFLARLCTWLIIEFVPKADSQVQLLLRARHDIFSDYSREAFDRAFGSFFSPVRIWELSQSTRIMYLLRRKVDIL